MLKTRLIKVIVFEWQTISQKFLIEFDGKYVTQKINYTRFRGIRRLHDVLQIKKEKKNNHALLKIKKPIYFAFYLLNFSILYRYTM